jgi:hypothetical protein
VGRGRDDHQTEWNRDKQIPSKVHHRFFPLAFPGMAVEGFLSTRLVAWRAARVGPHGPRCLRCGQGDSLINSIALSASHKSHCATQHFKRKLIA